MLGGGGFRSRMGRDAPTIPPARPTGATPSGETARSGFRSYSIGSPARWWPATIPSTPMENIMPTLWSAMCALWTCFVGVASANDKAPEPVASESQAWLHVLVEAEDWPGLRTESLRLTHHQPTYAPLWRYYEAWALLQLDRPRDAVVRFVALADEGPPELRAVASLAAARAWRPLEPELAAQRYLRLITHSREEIRAAATLGAAWTDAELVRFDAARARLPTAPPHLQELLERPRWRRPGVAALLSAGVPGLGQMYANAPAEGVAAFFVVGALATGTVLLARSEGASPGTIALGAFAVSFYGGNIYGAADAAARHNRRKRREAVHGIESLEATVWPEVPPAEAATSAPAPH